MFFFNAAHGFCHHIKKTVSGRESPLHVIFSVWYYATLYTLYAYSGISVPGAALQAESCEGFEI